MFDDGISGPSQRDVASLASRMQGRDLLGALSLVPFDFLVLLGGLDSVEVLDGLQHGGAESGSLMQCSGVVRGHVR